MNERIKELAIASQLVYEEDGKLLTAWEDDFDLSDGLEKFAESIIKKCLELCYCRGMNDELYAGQLKAAAYIEEYFGVEA